MQHVHSATETDLWHVAGSIGDSALALAAYSPIWSIVFGIGIMLVGLRIAFDVIRYLSRPHFYTRRGKYGITGMGSICDDARLFTHSQKAQGHARANFRCEFERNAFSRCRNASTAADHYFSHSRGGATSMLNFVASCDMHNIAKGRRMPTVGERMRLQIRRYSYFPKFEQKLAGEWTYLSKRRKREYLAEQERLNQISRAVWAERQELLGLAS